MPALVIAPMICARTTTAARVYVRHPMSTRARVTAGLNKPPLMRKKIHAQTARLKPNDNEMYSSVLTDGMDPSASARA